MSRHTRIKLRKSSPYAFPRKPVLADNVVATSQPLAAQAGLQVLAEGGSAVDAAVATAITLTVVEPVSNGIGSDAFAMVWDGEVLHGLNGSGRSPAGWTPEYFGGCGVPLLGWNSVTVPGAVSAWLELHDRFGELPFARLAEPAIKYAREGFLVTPTVAGHWAAQAQNLESQPGFAETFMPAGRAPSPGERFASPHHAATLEKIVATNGEAFYGGELSGALEAHSSAHGGVMKAADLAAHSADWVGTIAADYRGYTVHEMPPNGQGIITLIALGILAHFDIAALPIDSAESVHLQIEALKLAIADAHAYVADIDHMRTDPSELLDPGYLEERARLVDPQQAQPVAAGMPRGGTVYLTVAAADGSMVSMIQSNFMGFGSGVVVPGTGIALQNRGCGFTAAQGHPNEVGPRKRPFHTILPAFLTQNGTPVMSFGATGGPMQPQTQVQVIVRLAEHGQNPQAACDGPRFRWIEGLQVALEDEFPAETFDGLRRRGHEIVTTAERGSFGNYQSISRLESGYFAASEPRCDGQAVGF